MTNETSDPLPLAPDLVPGVRIKAALLLVLLFSLLLAAGLFLLKSRGFFDPTQRLVLVADNSEGVAPGMNLTFSGFPIGQVRRAELAEDGSVRILIDVLEKDARWLRESSIFTLERGLVGGTQIRAYTGILNAAPLPDGAVRPVLRGDASAEIPKVLSSVKDLLNSLNALTRGDGPVMATVSQLQTTTARLNGPRGALGVLTGSDADARKIIESIERTNVLLGHLAGLAQSADGVARKADTLIGNADAQVFGPRGLTQDVKVSLGQVNALLEQTRASLKKVDAVLVEAQGVGANVRSATTDLGPLRAEVEASLRRVEGLIGELHRKWPLARDTEVKLP
jgi:phospholipid/cholesterol/gamma-HCH transport system substrate-binding protein